MPSPNNTIIRVFFACVALSFATEVKADNDAAASVMSLPSSRLDVVLAVPLLPFDEKVVLVDGSVGFRQRLRRIPMGIDVAAWRFLVGPDGARSAAGGLTLAYVHEFFELGSGALLLRQKGSAGTDIKIAYGFPIQFRLGPTDGARLRLRLAWAIPRPEDWRVADALYDVSLTVPIERARRAIEVRTFGASSNSVPVFGLEVIHSIPFRRGNSLRVGYGLSLYFLLGEDALNGGGIVNVGPSLRMGWSKREQIDSGNARSVSEKDGLRSSRESVTR